MSAMFSLESLPANFLGSKPSLTSMYVRGGSLLGNCTCKAHLRVPPLHMVSSRYITGAYKLGTIPQDLFAGAPELTFVYALHHVVRRRSHRSAASSITRRPVSPLQELFRG